MRRPRGRAGLGRVGAALLLLGGPVAAGAQSCPEGAAAPPAPAAAVDPVLQSLLGAWEGTGTLMGRPARFGMEWSLALDGRFLRLAFENALVGPDGEAVPVLSAVAFYRTDGEPRPGSWADTRGALLELCGRVTDGALVVDWAGAGERGRTTYRPMSDGTVQVADSVETASGLRGFGSASYRRLGSAGPGADPPRGPEEARPSSVPRK